MKTKAFVSILMILSLIFCNVVVSDQETEVINVIAGFRGEYIIDVLYLGEDGIVTFYSETPEGIEVEFSPNPVFITEDTQVVRYVNISIALAPGQYFFTTYGELEVEEKTYSSNKKTTYISTTVPKEKEEVPWYHPPVDDNVTRVNEYPPIYWTYEPEGIGFNVWYCLFIILGSIIMTIIWKKRKGKNNE